MVVTPLNDVMGIVGYRDPFLAWHLSFSSLPLGEGTRCRSAAATEFLSRSPQTYLSINAETC
jgi:hypothetical protein